MDGYGHKVTTAARIVVVDDAPDVRLLVRTMLRVSGSFDVVGEAGDGEAAVALAEREQPDLMLLDVSMPRMDGLSALPRVRAVSPRTRVVLYTGFDERGLARRARELGAAAFLEKSAKAEEVVETLLAALPDDRRAAVDPPAVDTDAGDDSVLTEHLERFREVFEEAAIGMATMTLSGHLVRTNRAFSQLVGRPVEELVGAPYVDLAGDQTGAAVARVESGEQDVAQFEHDVPGTGRRALATIAPVRDSHGRALYLFLQLQDVTAQRGAEKELLLSEERFRLLVEAVEGYAIFMLDPSGHVMSWNAGAERIKGYTAEEIIGQHFRNFYPPEKQAEQHPEHELEWALRDGRYEEEGWRVRKDGSRFWASVLITAVRDESGRHIGFAKVTRDFTERRRMLEDLEDANRRLHDSAREQADFLSVTAHELRTPIGVVGAAIDILARHADDLTGDERGDLLESMAGSASRLRRLLNDLLTASRLEAGTAEFRREPFDVGRVLRRAVDSVATVMPSAQITVEAPAGLTAYGDPDRIAQAVENLVANAVTHGAPPVHVLAVHRDRWVDVRVSDAGDGVPDRVRERLFERFVTGKPRSGTGLGLYIVREIARAQGGHARYEPPTADRRGAFVVTIPGGP